MDVKIALHNVNGNPSGKLADVELHFKDGDLDGLKLLGFAIWSSNGRLNVTFPARQYQVNGERRSFALLRAINLPGAQERLRDLILQAYNAQNQNGRIA